MPEERRVEEFVGVQAGDCECWCLNVTEEEYLRVAGEESHRMEKKDREESKEFYERMGITNVWRLYPSDFFRLLGVKEFTKDKKVRFRIEIMEEED